MKKLILITLLLGSVFHLQGQDTTGIPSENVEVIKRYQASIIQAKRKKLTFEKRESTKAPINYNYNISGEKIIDFERPAPEIRPLGYEGEPVTQHRLKNGYLYGGYGTHNTINAGAAYHYFIEDWLEAGFKVDHFSARGDTLLKYRSEVDKEIERLRYSNTEAKLYFGYHLGGHSVIRLSGDLDLRNHNQNSLPSVIGELDTIVDLQVNKQGGDLLFDHNTFEENGFALRFGGGYHTAQHRSDSYDDNFSYVELNIIKKLSEKLTAELPLQYDRSSIGSGVDTLLLMPTFSDYILRPNLRFKGQNYLAKLGLEYISGSNASYFMPIIDVSIDRVVSIVDLRIYTESDYHRNSFYNLIDEMPYLSSQRADYSSSYRRSYNLKPSVVYSDFNFGLNIAYRTFENEANYIGFSELGRYEISYLDREEIGVTPELAYAPSEDIEFRVAVDYNGFLNQDSLITYRPQWATTFSGRQAFLKGKLKLQQDLIFLGARKHLERNSSLTEQFVELSSYMDVSLGIRYKISEAFDIYIQGTNLLPSGSGSIFSTDPHAANWRNYPILRQQIWAGLKLRI